MKRLLLALVVLSVPGFLLFKFGGRVLTDRHQVVDFHWKLPPGRFVTLSDSLAIEGVHLALRASSRDPTSWQPVPVAKESADAVLHKGVNPNAGLVILTNSNSTAQLYARVELHVASQILDIVISRPK
jgi:hypothetical protein